MLDWAMRQVTGHCDLWR